MQDNQIIRTQKRANSAKVTTGTFARVMPDEPRILKLSSITPRSDPKTFESGESAIYMMKLVIHGGSPAMNNRLYVSGAANRILLRRPPEFNWAVILAGDGVRKNNLATSQLAQWAIRT